MPRTSFSELADAHIVTFQANHVDELALLSILAEEDTQLGEDIRLMLASVRRNLEAAYLNKDWGLLLRTLDVELDAARKMAETLGIN